MEKFILKGDIVYSTLDKKLVTLVNHFVVVDNGICKGVFKTIPSEYISFAVIDYSKKLIVPGFIDLHLHASQYQFRGTGMDAELLDWLKKYTYVEEGKFGDLKYASKSYSMFVEDIKNGFTTRACIFATSHKESTLNLMDQLEKSGLVSYVGLVGMDRCVPDCVKQKNVESASKDIEEYIKSSLKFINTKPIITPRFLPSCSDELMKELSFLRKKYNLPVQSHLNENMNEIKTVMEIEKNIQNYSDGYKKFSLFGLDHNCIMAHCIHNNEKEIQMLKDNNIFVAHCPESNLNLVSGMAPIAKYLDKGINVGLGSDIAAGSCLSILRAMRQAIQVSKMYSYYVNKTRVLGLNDVFYMATLSGGQFFGKVGSFLDGYEFDALVLDDSLIPTLKEVTLAERLERIIYLGDERLIVGKYCKGQKII